jgi:hypothetical protein
MKSFIATMVLTAALPLCAMAQDKDITAKMPQVINGKVVDPLAVPPAPKTYPRITREGNEPRLQVRRTGSTPTSCTACASWHARPVP